MTFDERVEAVSHLLGEAGCSGHGAVPQILKGRNNGIIERHIPVTTTQKPGNST